MKMHTWAFDVFGLELPFTLRYRGPGKSSPMFVNGVESVIFRLVKVPFSVEQAVSGNVFTCDTCSKLALPHVASVCQPEKLTEKG